jgi:metal-sulfur cluster biosynthetic enzyme
MRRSLLPIILTFCLVATGTALAQEATPEATPDVAAGRNVRNVRYCEVLPVVLKQGKLVASVYNTLGLNDCPEDAWKAMDVNAIRKQFGAVEVELNGPRYWMMDEITGKGVSKNGETVTIGGLGFTKRAEVVLTLNTMKPVTYQEREIERETEYVFDQGKPVYELLSPDGHTYVMQTYSQTVDPKLTIDDLPTLGDRLELPDGWTYREVILDQDMSLSANGVAHLIQDDLQNSYQRIEPTDRVDATPEATWEATPEATAAS